MLNNLYILYNKRYSYFTPKVSSIAVETRGGGLTLCFLGLCPPQNLKHKVKPDIFSMRNINIIYNIISNKQIHSYILCIITQGKIDNPYIN